MSVMIREAVLDDARAIARVHVESWQQAYRGLIPDSYLARLSIDKREVNWRKSLAERTVEVWVAELPDGISGWIAFGASRDEDATGDVGEVEAIYIDPRHWRRGIGKALWLKAQKRLIARHFSSATLWVLAGNSSAIRFYETQGFAQSRTPVRISERDGKELVEIRYESVLTKIAHQFVIADTASIMLAE